MNRTRILALMLALVVGAIAAACGGSDSDEAATGTDGGATSSAPSGEPTKLTVSYSWPTVDFMAVPLVVADEMGYFAEAGVEVELVFPPDPASSAKGVAPGASALGLVTPPAMAFSVKEGLGITAIGNYTTSNNWGLFTKPGTPIALDTLKGKKISGYGDSWTKAMLPFVLGAAGLTEQDVEVVTVDWDLPLLLSGKVDVATNNTENLRRLQTTNPAAAAKIKVVWQSPLIPSDPILWNKKLDQAAKDKVMTFFMGYGRLGDAEEVENARAV
ncbi:MAG: ABC transporter substrate-binding protein, partial [Gaiellales bacterium]